MIRLAGLALALAVLTGCQTPGRGIHSVPVARDYGRLEKGGLAEAEAAVAKARLAGAAQSAPYEFEAANQYLRMAYEEKRDGDRKGLEDYAQLARTMAETALRRSPSPEAVEPVVHETEEAFQEAFQQTLAQYAALDKQKAAQTAPLTLAHLTVALSRTEHEVRNGKWQAGAQVLPLVEADLRLILTYDTDGDGIPDIRDAAPLHPEDFDGFEDEDGAPDYDNDKDGIPDVLDAAPNEPETVNNYHDADGAPDALPALDPLVFAPGAHAALSKESEGYLRGVRHLLLDWPRLKLRIRGRASVFGTESSALDESRRRAELVRAYLVDLGVPAQQLVTTFYGAAGPAEDAALPRDRVDLILE